MLTKMIFYSNHGFMNEKAENIYKKIIFYHLPFLLYAGLIITVSSIPNLRSPEVKFLAFDKLAHFCEYAIFAFLSYRSFTHISSKITTRQALIISFGFSVIFASMDEYYQRFIPGRYFDIADIITDLCGAFLVLVILYAKSKKSIKSTS